MLNTFPLEDTTRLLDDYRASALTQLLVAGCTRFDVATHLDEGPLGYLELQQRLGLADRAAMVLLTGLRSLGLIELDRDYRVQLTSYGREKLSPSSRFNLRGYLGLGALSADTQNMIRCLEQDAPAGPVSFVYHEGSGPSVLDDPHVSDSLTRAMACRARNVAPFVADQLDLATCRHLVDVGGGHGIYALELLKRFPSLMATILDRRPPLLVARQYAQEEQLVDRVETVVADIHTHRLPNDTDAILMANILHDYNAVDARQLVTHYSGQLASGGRLMIVDAFLDSVPPGAPPISAGPRPVAAYSAMLFSISEGRCYRLDEYQSMMTAAGLNIDPNVPGVPAQGSILTGVKD